MSLSSGSTPKTLFALLASDEVVGHFPWPRVSWYWGDERFVPHVQEIIRLPGASAMVRLGSGRS